MNLARMLLVQASEKLDMPVEVTAGVPKIELSGNLEFSMEPHKGLLEYEQNRIVISSSIGAVTVVGEELYIRLLNQVRVSLVGKIHAVLLPGASE